MYSEMVLFLEICKLFWLSSDYCLPILAIKLGRLDDLQSCIVNDIHKKILFDTKALENITIFPQLLRLRFHIFSLSGCFCWQRNKCKYFWRDALNKSTILYFYENHECYRRLINIFVACFHIYISLVLQQLMAASHLFLQQPTRVWLTQDHTVSLGGESGFSWFRSNTLNITPHWFFIRYVI